VALNAYVRWAHDRVADPLGSLVARTGISPNAVTVGGLAVMVAGSALVVVDVRLAGAVILLGALSDALDGAVARRAGRASTFGGFLDSVTDRLGDAAMLGAVAWAVREATWLVAAAFAALVLALLTSYVRAKAESLGYTATVGVIERGERVAIVGAGMLAGGPWLAVVLGVLVVGGLWTVVARLGAVWCQSRQGEGPRRSPR
jgi:CDP-diacylglycerol--glycerol-3-phosphate 3-phosphatidyltransferase